VNAGAHVGSSIDRTKDTIVGRFPTTANPTGPDMLWELPPRDRGPCPTGFFDPPSPARPSP
jgi:hypothetical protein